MRVLLLTVFLCHFVFGGSSPVSKLLENNGNCPDACYTCTVSDGSNVCKYWCSAENNCDISDYLVDCTMCVDSDGRQEPVIVKQTGKVNLIGYYGNSGGCAGSGCTPTFEEIPAQYNVIIVTFLNFDSYHNLDFEISSLAPVQVDTLESNINNWKATSDPWGRKKLVLASIGGQNGRWPADITDDEVFTKLDSFMSQYGLDGIDIDLESSGVAGVKTNTNAFLRLRAAGYVLSAAPEAAQGPLTAYESLLAYLDWVHPQFYNNPPNAVDVPFVPEYQNTGDWQLPESNPWWLVTMDTTAALVGLSSSQRGIAVPATPSAAGNNNHWDLTLLATQVAAGNIQNVATWALGYDKQNDWGLAKAILPLLGEISDDVSESLVVRERKEVRKIDLRLMKKNAKVGPTLKL